MTFGENTAAAAAACRRITGIFRQRYERLAKCGSVMPGAATDSGRHGLPVCLQSVCRPCGTAADTPLTDTVRHYTGSVRRSRRESDIPPRLLETH